MRCTGKQQLGHFFIMLPGGASISRHGISASASNAGPAATQTAQPQHLGWSGHIRPEEVIDKLTERIADRMRNELRLELQKESETLQQRVAAENLQMDDYLARELETQNTCPVCYELMVPPEHAPQLLFPCGHTFCAKCIHSHYVTHGKRTCPICRKKIDSKAPNYSLQQLILNFVQKRQRMQGNRPEGMAAMTHAVVAGSRPDASTPAAGDTGQSNDEHDRLRRQSERIQIRLTVLMNELTDTISEAAALEGAAQSSRLVLDHLGAQEQDVLKRMAGLKAELELLQEQRSMQEAKVAKSEEEATAALCESLLVHSHVFTPPNSGMKWMLGSVCLQHLPTFAGKPACMPLSECCCLTD